MSLSDQRVLKERLAILNKQKKIQEKNCRSLVDDLDRRLVADIDQIRKTYELVKDDVRHKSQRILDRINQCIGSCQFQIDHHNKQPINSNVYCNKAMVEPTKKVKTENEYSNPNHRNNLQIKSDRKKHGTQRAAIVPQPASSTPCDFKDQSVPIKHEDVSQKKESQWGCCKCTFLNDLKNSNCEMCNYPRRSGDTKLESKLKSKMKASNTGKRKHCDEAPRDEDSDCMIMEMKPPPKRRKVATKKVIFNVNGSAKIPLKKRRKSLSVSSVRNDDDNKSSVRTEKVVSNMTTESSDSTEYEDDYDPDGVAYNSCLSSDSEEAIHHNTPINGCNHASNGRTMYKKSDHIPRGNRKSRSMSTKSTSEITSCHRNLRGNQNTSSDSDVPLECNRTRNKRRRHVSDQETCDESEMESLQLQHRNSYRKSKDKKVTKAPTVYYKNKQKFAEKARKRFVGYPLNDDGLRVISLPINTECTEYRSGTVYLTAFGRIPSDPAKALKYCDRDYIYPIGLKAYRVHPSTRDPRKNTKYFMEILDDGMEGPKYKVVEEDNDCKVYIEKKATKPGEIIIDKISKRAKEIGCPGARDTHGTSGKRYLGLRDYLCMGIIELLPNAKKCTTYWRSQRKYNIPPRPFFQNVKFEDFVICNTDC